MIFLYLKIKGFGSLRFNIFCNYSYVYRLSKLIFSYSIYYLFAETGYLFEIYFKFFGGIRMSEKFIGYIFLNDSLSQRNCLLL